MVSLLTIGGGLTSLNGMSPLITRLSDQPIIHAGLNARMNQPDFTNINGPSLVRMPDWATGRLGRYHLYFAHHKGHYIRLAYADDLAGPWAIYDPGVLDRRDSLFEPVNPTPDPSVPKPYWADDLGEYLYAHIASPDVHIDHATRTFHLYYHGLMRDGTQLTRHATSPDGIHFTPDAPLLGGPYFRMFRWGGAFYALDWEGIFYHAPDWAGPFTALTWRVPDQLALNRRDPDGLLHRLRHPHVFVDDDQRLHLTFTRMGDAPEAIYHAEMIPIAPAGDTTFASDPEWVGNPEWAGDPDQAGDATPVGEIPWAFGPAQLWLRPEAAWEGGALPITPSVMGTAPELVCELRDPMLFREGGQLYLAYCGGGEQAIGLARVDGL